MTPGLDAIVLGLGGMGSAATYRLAARGQRVLGLERFGPAHDRGASHGASRIIRQAYFEDPAYVPLLLRAYELWDQIEADSGQPLLLRCGGLMIGAPESLTVSGSRRSAEAWDLEHEVLDASDVARRVPTLRLGPGEVALYEPAAGVVWPEASVRAHLELASRAGADLRFHEPVQGWEPTPGGAVRVITAGGAVEAARLVIAAGAWTPALLRGLDLSLWVQRLVQFWFEPRGPAAFAAECHPVYIWELGCGVQFYGFPVVPQGPAGAKVAFFRVGEPCSPDTIDRQVHAEEVETMRDVLRPRLPDLDGRLVAARTCTYTNTPDEHFVLAPHPEHPQAIIAAGFSGHGFKFATVIGEILADLTIDGSTSHPIDPFDPGRLQSRVWRRPAHRTEEHADASGGKTACSRNGLRER